MKITSFNIKNYKGISETNIDLNGTKGSIYTLVGLNESGKTTILEAINNFNPDVDGVHVMAQKALPSESIKLPESESTGLLTPESPESFIPKKHKYNFNEDISIAAYVKISKERIQILANECKEEEGFEINVDTFPQELRIEHRYHFSNSEYTRHVTYWYLDPHIKKKDSQEFMKLPASESEWQTVARKVGELLPRIVYFPTFLFKFPERIEITGGKSDIEGNEYFKRMIEDALASLDDPLSLQAHIVDRILKIDPEATPAEWVAKWLQSHEKENVEATLVKLSQKISKEIFGRWQDFLGKGLGNKEVVIEIELGVGDDDKRIAYLQFKIRDNDSYFKVSERSLGFRWFFCFLLFTRFFRGNAKGESIFLFDEPASNLHSEAQSKLLESLKVIAADKNDIIYSTHSPYLINPLWLETTFIVSNGKLTDKNEAADADFGIEDANIKAMPYKTFVGKYAKKSHYFQPILDKIRFVPSMLEVTRKGVFTEGKSDFYILNWYKKYHDTSLKIDFIPIGGANNGSELMSLYLGHCLDFIFLLDGDEEGDKAKARYIEDLPITEGHIIQLTDIPESKFKVIENLLSDNMKKAIGVKFSTTKVNKKHIQRAFSQALSGKNDLPPDPETLANLEKLCDELKKRLPA